MGWIPQWKRRRELWHWNVEEGRKAGSIRQERPAPSREEERRPSSRGPSRGPRTSATGWYIQGEARRQVVRPQGWNGRGTQGDTPGLEHSGRREKKDLVNQKPLRTIARAGEAGVWRAPSPRIKVYKKGKEPKVPGIQSGAGRHEGGPTDWSIQEHRAHNSGSSGVEHEGGGDKMPNPRAQVTRLERGTEKEGKRPRTGEDRPVLTQEERSTRRNEEEWGKAAVEYVGYRKRGQRRRWRRQAGDG